MIASAAEVKFYSRAKYFRTSDGAIKLAQVQFLSFPTFRIPGYELVNKPSSKLAPLFEQIEADIVPSAFTEYDESFSLEKEKNPNAWKNLHRAKIKAFDKILCNPDLDTFATFTLSPKYVKDRASWDVVYQPLKVWLSNRVSRNSLKYVICPERHKKGGIHFHAIMNSSALTLSPAFNAHTGAPLVHNGQPLYNIKDFPLGFTSAERIQDAALDREKVAKYIFKYMGKQGIEGKIGGRYVLSGGDFVKPIYLYGNEPTEFISSSDIELRQDVFYRESDHEGIKYKEWSFI